MAATANHPDGSGGFARSATEPDEDIAAIAKQISDHAEVIYQTWKARGLAPNEILTCHNNLNAADKFGSVLTSSFSTATGAAPIAGDHQQTQQQQAYFNGRKSPTVDSDGGGGGGGGSSVNLRTTTNSNLEQMVNKFVIEDKARLASRQKSDSSPVVTSTAKNYPSSIQYALQKFEKRLPEVDVQSSVAAVVSKYKNAAIPVGSSPVKSNFGVTRMSPRFGDGKEGRQLSEQFVPTSNAPEMVKPTSVATAATLPLDDANRMEGVSTWPLKTRVNFETKDERRTNGYATDDNGGGGYSSYQYRSMTLPGRIEGKRNATAELCMDEVAKEEERLINALKTGAVIAADETKTATVQSAFGESAVKMQGRTTSLSQLDGSDVPDSATSEDGDAEETTRIADAAAFGGSNVKRNRAAIVKEPPTTALPNQHRTPTRSRLAGENVVAIASRQLTSNGNAAQAGGQAATAAANPVRPFLTRGSVAERVMLFEKCPTEILEKRTKVGNAAASPSWKNLASDVHSKIQNYSKEANQRKGVYPPHTTLQRHTKANKNVFIPRFYYPHGKPISQHQQNITFKNIEDAFQLLPNSRATKEQFSTITKACGCPLYWKAPLFIASGGEKSGYVEMHTFLEYWRDLTAICHDDASRFMRIVTRNAKRSYIIPEDLIPLVQDVVNTHPGLTFLKHAPKFHSRYVHTVICRVYYCVNQLWNTQITLTELRKSDFLRAIQLLEEEQDINQVTAYFSYEHFYVIYCKFWELDRDHDLYISKEDLARHSDHALSTRIIDRIFSKTRNSTLQDGKMSYTDFVTFLLAEEDKRHPRAVEYWFRCMDLDGDGYLSMYELEYFYEEQLSRMESMGIECLPFEDCLCQMLDMIQPRIPGKISLSDLKRCKMTPIFFDTFFNLEKYLDHEQRDPFASQRDHDSDMSDWDRYAAEEYEILVAEESGNEHCEDIDQYEMTENEDDNTFSSMFDDVLNDPRREFVNQNNTYTKQNDNYLAENFLQPSMLVTNYEFYDKSCNSDSSDDYAGDSDDCSL